MIKPVASLILCAFAISAPAARADHASLQTTFQARYAAMKAAMGARDDRAVVALLAPDFTSIDVSGQTESAAQMLQELGSLPKDPLKTSETALLSIKVNGKSAIVEQRYDMKTVKVAADGTKRNVELITRSTDAWVNTKGNWLLQKTETDRMDYYINGQQVVHKVRSGA